MFSSSVLSTTKMLVDSLVKVVLVAEGCREDHVVLPPWVWERFGGVVALGR